MSILKNFEKRLGGAVEGVFAYAFRSKLEPVELFKAIERYQGDYRYIGVNSTTVPNVYRFNLSPADFDRLPMQSLQRELAEHARETAHNHKWQINGAIRIEFDRDERIKVGTYDYAFSTDQTVVPDNDAVSRPEPGHVPAPSDSSSTSLTGTPTLRVISTEDQGAVFTITGDAAVIGRLLECEVTLTGTGVSRRHARIDRTNTGWSIIDLGSTNGISVNNRPVNHSPLRSGDRIDVGDVTFHFSIVG